MEYWLLLLSVHIGVTLAVSYATLKSTFIHAGLMQGINKDY